MRFDVRKFPLQLFLEILTFVDHFPQKPQQFRPHYGNLSQNGNVI